MMKSQRLLLSILVLVSAIVIAVTATIGVFYAGASAQERARDSALDSARSYVSQMFAWNSKTVDENIKATMGRLTGAAKKEYWENVVREKIAEGVKAQGVSMVVTVEGAGVIENTRTTARVLLFMNQSSTRNDASEVTVDSSRLILGMEKQGDSWKINEIDILVDDSLDQSVEVGEGTPPSDAVPIPGASTSQQAPAPTD